MEHIIKPIGTIVNDFQTKFGIPRQSGLVDARSMIIFEPEFRNPDCFRGIERYSHLWLIWQFSENTSAGWKPTVRPPRLGGNVHRGVFATRSPFRPNSLGLSSVKLIHYEEAGPQGPALYVSGADLMNGTPIFDIKPYMCSSDCRPDAFGELLTTDQGERLAERPGDVVDADGKRWVPGKDGNLAVIDPDGLLILLPEEKRKVLIHCLELDPRPAYQKDPDRIYGMSFGGYNIRFKADTDHIYIEEVCPL